MRLRAQKASSAASSGNHAGAVAYAAHVTGASAQVLMPTNTPQKKIDNVRRYGAEAIVFGDNYDQTEAEALRRAAAGATWISPYNDANVIAGARDHRGSRLSSNCRLSSACLSP